MRVPGQFISNLMTRTDFLTEKATSSQGSHWLLLARPNLGLGSSTDLLVLFFLSFFCFLLTLALASMTPCLTSRYLGSTSWRSPWCRRPGRSRWTCHLQSWS